VTATATVTTVAPIKTSDQARLRVAQPLASGANATPDQADRIDPGTRKPIPNDRNQKVGTPPAHLRPPDRHDTVKATIIATNIVLFILVTLGLAFLMLDFLALSVQVVVVMICLLATCTVASSVVTELPVLQLAQMSVAALKAAPDGLLQNLESQFSSEPQAVRPEHGFVQ
jgi:hypothetical protein